MRVLSSDARPLLAVLEREGDPTPTLSLAMWAPGDSAALIALGEVLRARLSASKLAAELRVDRDALFLDITLGGVTSDVMTIVHTALSQRIEPAPAQRAAVEARLAAAPVDGGPAGAAANACVGALSVPKGAGFDIGTAAGAERAERLRARGFGRDTIAFGLVGPASAVETVTASLEKAGPYPAARSEPDATTPAFGAELAPDLGPHSARLTLALRAQDAKRAVAAARRLGRVPHPISALAERAGFRLAAAVGAANAHGGCLRVTLEGPSPSFSSEAELSSFREHLATLTQRGAQLLHEELDDGADQVSAARAIARTEDGRAAARLAAWWALSKPREDVPTRGSLHAALLELSTAVGETKRGPLGAEIDKAARAGVAPPELHQPRVRLERGQGEGWLLVANPCAPGSEAPHRWGAAGLATISGAQERVAADRTIAIDPFVSAAGLGFVAHAHALPDETPETTTRALADAAMSAFYAQAPSGEQLLASEARALGLIRARFGQGAPGLAALGERSGEHPSLLEPLGVPLRMSRFEPIELSRRLRATAAGPLRVALIARQDDKLEARAAAEALSRWTGPADTKPCPAVAPAPAGRFEVREPRKGPSVVHFLLPVDASVQARPLARTFVALATLAGANARLIESETLLYVHLSRFAPDEELEAAEQATHSWLKSGATEQSEAAVESAISQAARDHADAGFDPRVRLARVFAGLPATEHRRPSRAELSAWMQSNVKPERALIVVARPE